MVEGRKMLCRTMCSNLGQCTKVTLVCVFFISVFANVLILMMTHVHEHDFDEEERPVTIVRLLLTKALNFSDYKSDFTLRRELLTDAVNTCVAESINRLLHNPHSAPFWPSQEIIKIPPSLDARVARSLKFTLHREHSNVIKIFDFLSQPIINWHNFTYVHNPYDACLKRKIDLVIAVVSAPSYFEFRARTRKGLKGSYAFVKNNNATLLFFLGRVHPSKPESRRWQMEINMEMRTHGDIVQEDFIDVYKNLTLKSMSVLKWIKRFCPRAQFVIKADDDAGIKPATALEAMNRYRQRFGNFILGRWNPNRIVPRNQSSKIYVPYEEYPHSTFPPHLLGGALGFPVTTAKLLYQASLRVPKVWLDDIFLTGLCAPKVNVPLFSDAQFYFKHKEW